MGWNYFEIFVQNEKLGHVRPTDFNFHHYKVKFRVSAEQALAGPTVVMVKGGDPSKAGNSYGTLVTDFRVI